MKSKSKIIISNITRGENVNENVKDYAKLLACRYNAYATVRSSMNYYTMREIVEDAGEEKTRVKESFLKIRDLIRNYILTTDTVNSNVLSKIRALRDQMEYRMKILTAYIDAYQIYEYVLNRVEYGIKGNTQDVDTAALSDKMMQYVFSEQDTVVINSKLQLLMAQLPVRMTKTKFFDILSNTLNIYQGGETASVDEFCEMLLATVLAELPSGFDTEYPELHRLYADLSAADYKEISEHDFDDLMARLSSCVRVIQNEVSDYMLLTEITNDVYTMLLTTDACFEENKTMAGYAAAIEILSACVKTEGPFSDEQSDGMMNFFLAMEGSQEDLYEDVVVLEAAFDDVRNGQAEVIGQENLVDEFDKLDMISKLLSTSLFVKLDTEEEATGEPCDAAYIAKVKAGMEEKLSALFKDNSKPVVRSMMAKLLAAMPIFMNNTQEIKAYFDYVLGSVSDASELTATEKLITEIIEED